ncbi:MAG: hypothetical protein DHS80DRAFT_31560 [Piptocephalis tieghemiana]|nr:MAG: hypothetical protein DHS80DRAFT_31560 [Piptocephalis tieghemiana]
MTTSTPSPPLDAVDVEGLPPISPQATNTLLLSDVDSALFTPAVLDSVREVMEELGNLHSFSPLPGFGRIVIVYPTVLEAALAHHQLKANAIDQDLGCSLYFGGTTSIISPSTTLVAEEEEEEEEEEEGVTIGHRTHQQSDGPFHPTLSSCHSTISQGQDEGKRYPNLLTVPEAEQLWLISPPGSPPVGWESRPDDPPNMQPHADDIVAALHARFMDSGSQNMTSPSLPPHQNHSTASPIGIHELFTPKQVTVDDGVEVDVPGIVVEQWDQSTNIAASSKEALMVCVEDNEDVAVHTASSRPSSPSSPVFRMVVSDDEDDLHPSPPSRPTIPRTPRPILF